MKLTRKDPSLRRGERFTATEIAMALCLAAAVAYTLYLIFAKLNPYGIFNSDMANELEFRRVSWEKKSLFPEGYVCGYESLSTRPVLLYWLFYAITHRFLLSFQLENTCTFFLELAVIYYFLTKLNVSRGAKFFSLFLLVTCLTPGVMLFHFWPMNGNVLFTISVFLTLALRISLEEAEKPKDKAWRIGIILLLALAFGYGTVKMALYLYLPLILLDGSKVLLNYFKQTPNAHSVRTLCTSVVALGVNVLSYGLFLLRHSDFIVASSFTIVSMDKWLSWEVLSAQIKAILLCFGIPEAGGKIASLAGIQFVLCVVIAVVEVAAVLWLLWNGSNQAKKFTAYWGFAMLTLFMSQVLLGTTESIVRYYPVVATSIHVLCGCAVSEWMKKRNGGLKLLAVVAAIVTAFLGTRVVADAKAYVGTPPLAQAAAYAEENGYQYVVGGYWNAGVLTGYSDGHLEAWHSDPLTPSSIVKLSPYPWAVDTTLFTQERLGERGLLILTDLEEQAIFEENSYVAILLNEYAEKVTEISSYNLYAVTENPYTLIEKIKHERASGLPAADQTEKVDMPGADGYCYANNAALNENGELASDGVTGGTILYGPYSDTVSGVYDITLNYVVDSVGEGTEGTFDVALDAKSYAATTFTADQTSATLENVSIEDGHQFEARVSIPAEMAIRVQSIHYARVG